ncbi:MAG: ATP-binding cassette domain-containing protein [Hyphomicrobiales bacterium]|nr:ATP-binding cassette domain-containing protein [Hyphomicrobiales bacterium]
MQALLSIENVSVSFPQPKRLFGGPRVSLRAVDDVCAEIAEGETLALVGESGSGKTTLGHVVAGLRKPSAGRVRLRGAELNRNNRALAGRAIQIVFQDPFSALDPRMPVSDIVAEPLRIQRIGGKKERRERAAVLVEEVGLPADALNRYPHEFSGGQRQRIAIARALAPAPELIVADEPLSALDVSIQSQILNLFRDIQKREKLSYLFISHDLGVVEHLADRVAVLYLGRVIELARREDIFTHPAHPYTRALLDSMPRIGTGRRRKRSIGGEMPSPLDPPPGCVFHPRCPLAQDICRKVVPRFEPLAARPSHSAACHFKEQA